MPNRMQIKVRSQMIVNRAKRIWSERKSRFKECDAFNDIEGLLVNSYMIASESFDDMNDGIKPSLSRRVKAWSVIALLCLMVAIESIAIYWDDQDHYTMLGIACSLIPFPRFIIIALVLIFSIAIASRIIFLICEKREC